MKSINEILNKYILKESPERQILRFLKSFLKEKGFKEDILKNINLKINNTSVVISANPSLKSFILIKNKDLVEYINLNLNRFKISEIR